MDRKKFLSDIALARIEKTVRESEAMAGNPKPIYEMTLEDLAPTDHRKRFDAYASDIRQYVAWSGRSWPFPASETMIKEYLHDMFRTIQRDEMGFAVLDELGNASFHYSLPTMRRHRAAISWAHRLHGYDDPTKSPAVRALLRSMEKAKPHKPCKAPPFTMADLAAMANLLESDGSLPALRDRALIIVGTIGAFRQNELANVMKEDLVHYPNRGYTIACNRRIGGAQRSPGTRDDKPKVIPYANLPIDPARALDDWLDASGLQSGPLFRRLIPLKGARKKRQRESMAAGKPAAYRFADHPMPLSHPAINDLLRAAAKRAGLEPTLVKALSAHSMRATYIKTMRQFGFSDKLIAEQTKHSELIHFKVYDDEETLLQNRGAVQLMGALAKLPPLGLDTPTEGESAESLFAQQIKDNLL
jgi:integrase